MDLKFRLLRADEIQCRIGTINDKGLSLLLYKDARCDMAILDETVGAMNWMRHHSRENANCTVSIWDAEKGQWIDKEDTGTESNTEAEKGLASDSFKRACTNWGIGRELYTSPFIWIPKTLCNIDGRKCYDRFEVLEISYTNDRRIFGLTIGNATKNSIVFTTDKRKKERETPPRDAEELTCAECGKPIKAWTRGDEVIMTAEEVSANAVKDYGKPMCLSCIKARKKQNENAD